MSFTQRSDHFQGTLANIVHSSGAVYEREGGTGARGGEEPLAEPSEGARGTSPGRMDAKGGAV